MLHDKGFPDNGGHSESRVEAAIWILEDHLNVPAVSAELGPVETLDIVTMEQHLARTVALKPADASVRVSSSQSPTRRRLQHSGRTEP